MRLRMKGSTDFLRGHAQNTSERIFCSTSQLLLMLCHCIQHELLCMCIYIQIDIYILIQFRVSFFTLLLCSLCEAKRTHTSTRAIPLSRLASSYKSTRTYSLKDVVKGIFSFFKKRSWSRSSSAIVRVSSHHLSSSQHTSTHIIYPYGLYRVTLALHTHSTSHRRRGLRQREREKERKTALDYTNRTYTCTSSPMCHYHKYCYGYELCMALYGAMNGLSFVMLSFTLFSFERVKR